MTATDPLSDLPESSERQLYNADYRSLQRRRRADFHRHLQLLQKILFFLAAMLLLGIAVWSNWRSEDWYAPPRDIIRSEDLSLSVRNARYAGLDAGKLPFSITADEIIQDKSRPNELAMVSPKADILLHNGGWLYMWADNAIIENNTHRLLLNDNVNIHFSDGYELQTQEVRLNMRLGIISGDQPVTAQGLDVNFSGLGFRIHNSGRNIAVSGPTDFQIADSSLRQGQLKIHAEEILEWFGAENKYTAEGGVIIQNGQLTLRADKVELFYVTAEDEEIYKGQKAELIKAYGAVELQTNGSVIHSEQAFYEVPRERVRFIGEDLHLRSGDIRLTADKFIEYGSDNSTAVAHGTVNVVNAAGNSLAAETIRAKIADLNGKKQVSYLTATKDVRVNNGETQIFGNDGYYDFTQESGEVCGNLKIIQGDNIFDGECAGINLKSGVSYVDGSDAKDSDDPASSTSSDGRVRGTLQAE